MPISEAEIAAGRIRPSASRRVVALALPLLLLAACQTGPVYQARGPGSSVGYTDQELTSNRYRVTFSGGAGTSRNDVEDYLLRRAAEVTENAGYRYFKFDTRDTEAKTYYRTTFDAWDPAFGPGFGYYYGRPYYYRPFYWSSWDFPPYWGTSDTIPVTRYTAYAEIVMLTPQQAENNPEAIPAREVLARLAPQSSKGAPPA